jgi:hypothetical protein
VRTCFTLCWTIAPEPANRATGQRASRAGHIGGLLAEGRRQPGCDVVAVVEKELAFMGSEKK